MRARASQPRRADHEPRSAASAKTVNPLPVPLTPRGILRLTSQVPLCWIVLLAAADCLAAAAGGENDWFVYLGNKAPPKAPQKQISAAEALPPLPLPATPLRRTERKKPPPPDYLVGKMIWGESASFTDTNGDEMQIADWNLCPSDMQRLLERARETGLAYHGSNVNLSDFDFDPGKLPALVF